MKTITYTDRSSDGELRKKVAVVLQGKQTGDWRLYTKAGILLVSYLTLYAIPFFLVLPGWLILISSVISGILMAAIGIGIMHDANHGSFSRKKWINTLFGSSMYLVGGYLPNWKMQHNVIHHTYTNVHDHDDDLDTGGILRFSPRQPWKPHHKYQVFIAPFLYAIMTIFWITSKDFVQVARYKKEGKKDFQNRTKRFVSVSISKVAYLIFWLVIPLMFWKSSWSVAVGAFFMMHFTAGLLLALIFQPAHVSSLTVFEKEPVFRSRTEQQIRTSCNFATKSPFVTWISGGLNYQIEHHLFPNISHVHYPKIAPIVQAYCKEKGLPYNNLGSFWSAVRNHFNFLKYLGATKVV